jgi:hypothetical protein
MKSLIKKNNSILYRILNVVSYSYPIWFIIGVIPWSYMVDDYDLWYKLLHFQIGGLIGVVVSGSAAIVTSVCYD